MDNKPLGRELAYYQAHRDELLSRYAGQFVVIHDDQVIGTFTTEEEAYAAGLLRVGNKPFLIRRVMKDDPEVQYPALTVGMISGAHT